MSKENTEGCWISLILRLAMGSLFGAAAIGKFVGGLDKVLIYFDATFKNTWLPSYLVGLHACWVPHMEVVLALWLITGWRLRLGWIVAGFFLVTLAFGMVVAKQYGTAADNYFYVLFACVGLYFSQYDRWNINRWVGAK